MRNATMIIAALALLALAAPVANAQKLDANGKCHDAKGRFAKAEVCKGAAPAMGAMGPARPAPATGYKLDAKGNCHDAKGKMAKKDLCKA